MYRLLQFILSITGFMAKLKCREEINPLLTKKILKNVYCFHLMEELFDSITHFYIINYFHTCGPNFNTRRAKIRFCKRIVSCGSEHGSFFIFIFSSSTAEFIELAGQSKNKNKYAGFCFCF